MYKIELAHIIRYNHINLYKMPKSRDQRCRRALNTFFDAYPFHFETEKLNLRGYVYARYEITANKEWFYNEPNYNAEERSLTWNQVLQQQELPDAAKIAEIEANFHTTFRPYEKPDTSMRLHEVEANEEKVVFKIIVQYFKSHIPFPEDEASLEQRLGQLERKNEELNNRLFTYDYQTEMHVEFLNRRNLRMNRELCNANERVDACKAKFQQNYAGFMWSYRNIIRKCYAETGKSYECPVCYDSIANEKLFVTPCNHILCNECASHCNDTCPLCRQEMTYSPTLV